jgi:hypothetical protein
LKKEMTMKKGILLFAAVVALSGSVAMAFDPLGPPAATGEKGVWSIGLEGSHSEMSLERVTHDWSGDKRNCNVDTEIHKVYAKILYGVSDNVTGFVRAGAASMEWDSRSGRSYDWEGHDGDWGFAWGGGFAATLSESPDTTWGCILQLSQANCSGEQKESYYGDTGNYHIKLMEIQFAVGPTWRASDTVRLYGGPFVSFVRGTWEDAIWGYELRKPIEEEAFWGLYGGAAVDVNKNSFLNVEGMFTGDGWGVAGGVVVRCP